MDVERATPTFATGKKDFQMSMSDTPLVEPRTSDLTMETIPEDLVTPRDGNGAIALDAGRLTEARNKLAAALSAFSAAQSAVPGLEAAITAGVALPLEDLVELDRVRSALAEAAEVLHL